MDLKKMNVEFKELLYEELGIPKDLMTIGAVDIENEKTKIDFREHAPELDLDEFNRTCNELKAMANNYAKEEAKRNDELMILQILWVYEANASYEMYRNFINGLGKEMMANSNKPIAIRTLSKEQVEFINSIKRTPREEKGAKIYVKQDFKPFGNL